MPFLSQSNIQQGLRTKRLGRNLILTQSTRSTNTDLAALAAQGAAHGTVVAAETQTEGRGRQNRQWHSPVGVGLYFSLLLRPEIDLARAMTFPLVAGCAVAKAIEKFIAPEKVMIKWPNDLLVKGKKICGILCTSRNDGSTANCLIAGIGINVNLDVSTLPSETATLATSLLAITGRTTSREELFAEVLNSLEATYDRWLKDGFLAILPEISERDALKERRVMIALRGEPLSGTAVGIAENGALAVRLSDQTIEYVYSGEAHIVARS